MSQVKEDLKGR